MTATSEPTKRVAIIGSGYFSQFHIAAWQRLPVTIAGMLTLDEATGDALCERFDIQQRYTSIDELLDDQVDLVDIIVPPEAQLGLIKPIAERRTPMICQKPFCRDLEQAREATAFCASHNTALVVHENFRHQPWYRAIHKELSAGRLGKVYQATFRLRPGDGQGADAYLARQPYFRDQPEFLVRETAVHLIDVFRYLFGEVDEVFASLQRLNPVIKGEDAGLMMMRFASGIRTVIDANRLADHAADNTRLTMGELRIEGEKGELTLDGFARIFFRAHGSTDYQAISYDWQDVDFGGDCVYLTQKHILSSVFDYQRSLDAALHNTSDAQAANGNSDKSEIENGIESGLENGLENKAGDYLINRRLERLMYESAETKSWLRT